MELSFLYEVLYKVVASKIIEICQLVDRLLEEMNEKNNKNLLKCFLTKFCLHFKMKLAFFVRFHTVEAIICRSVKFPR